MLKVIRDWIASKDEIVEPSALKLHFNQDYRLKTLIGGCTSLLIQSFVAYIVISKLITMVNRDDAAMSSIEAQIDEDLEIPFAEAAKTVFSIWDGDDSKGIDGVFAYIPLDRETRRYLHVNVNNKI